MRQFYRQMGIDRSSLDFFARCPGCTAERHSRRLPLLCRSRALIDRLENGTAGPLRQRCYSKAKASAVQQLARYFSFCPGCGSWLCDSCYDGENPEGICKQCEANKRKDKEETT